MTRFVQIPGVEGRFFVPDKTPHDRKKNPCADCRACQMCSDARCSVCREEKAGAKEFCAKGGEMTYYSVLDRPEVSAVLFHPRPEWGESPYPAGTDVSIPVEADVVLGGRFHMDKKESPNILFFHGNGEIVSDYDDMGPVYNRIGINFLPVDYRGYGRSTGNPTISSMMKDCSKVLIFISDWLRKQGCPGPLIVMGRSLGSASAIELAAASPDRVAGLIVESGFAYAEPLLRLLGVDTKRLGFKEEEGFRNIDKIKVFKKPTLIIHAEKDHIIPFSDGRALYEASGAEEKRFLKIAGANHNDIFARGLSEYMDAVAELVWKVQ